MLGGLRKSCASVFVRQFHASSRTSFQATVIGAAGGIGQPLSMLLRYNPLIKSLNLYDIAPVTPGVAADLSHVNTSGSCTGFSGKSEEMEKSLEGSDIVIIPAGVPRQPGMSRDDLFDMNGGIVRDCAKACAKSCPDAKFLIISNPVNSTVPIFAETMKQAGVYDSKKLFGVTTLDVCRANCFVADHQGWVVEDTDVTVIGGHAGITILPLLSHVANAEFSSEDIEKLSHRVAFGGDEVVKAKAGNGSATLSMAHAAAVFTNQVLKAANGEHGIVQCTYVDSNLDKDLSFFASPVRLGLNGVEEILPFPKLSDFEQKMFDKMKPDLVGQIAKGVEFANRS